MLICTVAQGCYICDASRVCCAAGSPCFFHMDVTLFTANSTGDCPERTVLDVLPSIPGHKACCRECTARSGVAGAACRAFSWTSTNMDCTLYEDEPENVCDMQDEEGAISGQMIPKGGAKLKFPLKASMRNGTPRLHTKVTGKRRSLHPSLQSEGPASARPTLAQLQPGSRPPSADAK
jgi:hypothetical protein